MNPLNPDQFGDFNPPVDEAISRYKAHTFKHNEVVEEPIDQPMSHYKEDSGGRLLPQISKDRVSGAVKGWRDPTKHSSLSPTRYSQN